MYIYKKSIFNRCTTVRPDRKFLNGKYRIIANYFLMPKPNDDSANDNQPDILVDDLIHNTQKPSNYPSSLTTYVFKGKIKVSEGQSSFAISRPKLTITF